MMRGLIEFLLRPVSFFTVFNLIFHPLKQIIQPNVDSLVAVLFVHYGSVIN